MTEISRSQLARRLGLGAVDDRDLHHVLLFAVGGAAFTTDRRIDFPEAEVPALSLIYDKQGKIREIVPGPGLTSGLLDTIEQAVSAELLQPVRHFAYRQPLFSWYPTEGYWRYNDKLAIRAVPDDAPSPQLLMAPHPLIFEVMFDSPPSGIVQHIRAQREFNKYALFLSLLVPGIQIPMSNRGWSHKWFVTTPVQPDQPRSPTSILGQEYYLIPDFQPYAEALSSQGDLPDVELVRQMPLTLEINQKFTLPVTLARRLGIFERLSESDRRKVLRAAYWIHYAQKTWSISGSGSYQAMVQAVETLVEIPKGQPICHECSRSIGPGPTKLFTEFIDQFTPAVDAETKAPRRALYTMRSRLTHGSHLFYDDEEVDFGWNSPAPRIEDKLAKHAQNVCRQAIVGWLDSRSAE